MIHLTYIRLSKLILRACMIIAVSSNTMADAHHVDSPSYKVSQIAKDMNLLQGKGGNIILFQQGKESLMIDSDYQEMSQALKTTLDKLLTSDSLTYIINTHWHGDHTGGNHSIKHDAHIIAHNNVRTRLLTRQEIKLFNRVVEPLSKEAVPNLTYKSAMQLYLKDEKIDIVHYPNTHTDGDSVIFFNQANVVHMGDLYFAGMFPFIDVGSGGSTQKLIESIDQILTRIDNKTQVVPGHGALSTKKNLIMYQDMLKQIFVEVKAMKGKGMSLEAMQEQGLSEQWGSWGEGFIDEKTWITITNSQL